MKSVHVWRLSQIDLASSQPGRAEGSGIELKKLYLVKDEAVKMYNIRSGKKRRRHSAAVDEEVDLVFW